MTAPTTCSFLLDSSKQEFAEVWITGMRGSMKLYIGIIGEMRENEGCEKHEDQWSKTDTKNPF